MGVAVTGMHYTGMAAVSVHLAGPSAVSQSSADLLSFLLAMLAGPLVVLLIAAVIVMFDPDMVLGDDDDWSRTVPASARARHDGGDHTSSAQRSTPPSTPW
jgi:hypothetical protein